MDENTSASSSVTQEEIIPAASSGAASEIYTGPYEVIAEVVDVPDRPFFTTPFEDYTVTEGLLLLLVVLLVIRWIIGMLKGGFSWL